MYNLAPTVELCECTGGGIRLSGLRDVDFGTLQQLLSGDSRVLQIDRGTVTLYPEPAEKFLDDVRPSLEELSELLDAEAETIQTSGALEYRTFRRPPVGSNSLHAVLQLPNVLKITIADASLTVQVVRASDLKQGIAHQKRCGKLAPTTRRHKRWTPGIERRRRQQRWWKKW